MDLTMYFQKIRDAQLNFKEEFPVVVSLETGDGGKPNQMTETTQRVAARLIVEGKAKLAEPEQAAEFRQKNADAKAKADAEAAKAGLFADAALQKLGVLAAVRE